MAVATHEVPTLLERAVCLSELDGLLDAIRGGSGGQVALLGGEAGAGKTSLLRAFCASASERALWGSCEPLSTPRPHGPLIDIAAALGGDLDELLRTGARAHEVAVGLLTELGGRDLTILVLEDLHWADEATLDVLRLLAGRLAATRTLLLASYRDDEVGLTPALQLVLGDLNSRAPTRMTVPRLSPAAVALLCAGHGRDDAELYQVTRGNAFFVTEVLAARAGVMPESVRAAVIARAARLTDADRRLLEAVAIVPGEAEMWLLARVADDLIARLETCLASGMLVAANARVGFRHELARLAIEEATPPDRCVALHRRAVAALADSLEAPRDSARLAYHAEAADEGELVLRFAPIAAAQAAAAGAHREARAQYARALRFELDPIPRADLLQRFAEECYLTDMREEAVVALDEALATHRAHGDPARVAEVQRLRARQLVCVFRRDDAWVAAREAVELLEQLPPAPELARAYACLADLAAEGDDAAGATSFGLRAIELAESLGDTYALAHALNSVGLVEFARGDGRGRARLESALKVAASAGHELEAGRAYVNLAIVYSRRRDWHQAAPMLAQGIEYCRERGLDAWLSILLVGNAESQLARGAWDEAAELAARVLSEPVDSVVSQRFSALMVLALVRARRGDPEYWPLLDEAMEIARSWQSLEYLVTVAVARAEACWLEGDSQRIGAETDAIYALAVRAGEPSFIGELALWRWRAGLLTACPPNTGEVHRLQIAGEHERAALMWAERGCRYEAALTLADSTRQDSLHTALKELRALGAQPAAAITTRRLRAQGARGIPRGPYARTRANPAGLSARELDVLRLLADGLRNAQIAERLVVSVRTVDHHVSTILRKLGASSRAEAAAEAVKLGLDRPPAEDLADSVH